MNDHLQRLTNLMKEALGRNKIFNSKKSESTTKWRWRDSHNRKG